MVVRRVATAWNNFFASVKEYMANPSAFTGFPSYPKPKKLAKLTNFSLPLGPDKLSINVKNKRKKNSKSYYCAFHYSKYFAKLKYKSG